MYAFITDFPVTGVSQEYARVSLGVAIEFYRRCRGILIYTMQADPILFGVTGGVVQIDESVIAKRKYNVGRPPSEQKWVLGFYDVDRKVGHMEHVPNRSRETLHNRILSNVAPGSTIATDQWAGYNGLSLHGYNHTTVNHSRNFVCPETGTHTQAIESFWNSSKSRLRSVKGSQGDNVWDHIAVSEYRFRFKLKKEDIRAAWSLFLEDVSLLYPF